MSVQVTEGMRHGDVYVLTQAELNRVVKRETIVLGQEIIRLRDALRKKTYRADTSRLERRRLAYRTSAAKRYNRYRVLARYYGEPTRGGTWTRHLAELEKRYADSPPVWVASTTDEACA